MGLLKRMWKKAKTAVRKMKSKFDEGGSYTGSPDSPAPSKTPEQDADDL